MDSFQFGIFFGGIGLFLFGMIILTQGLKSASGPALAQILEKGTNTPIKGFISGFLSTTILQSSTATTLLAIGFINAGILSFGYALWFLFGSNVGSTMIGWIIALIGFEINIQSFSLPLIGIGVFLRVLGEKNIWGNVGEMFTGFGLLFLGLGFLQDSFQNVETLINFGALSGDGILSFGIFFALGFFGTLIMQSSSATMAIIITLAATAGLPIIEALCAVIGANIGTTATAVFASIGGTANAKRAAGAHVIFNIIAAIGACFFLPIIPEIFAWIKHQFDTFESVAIQIAFFHSFVNILGAILMIPLAKYIAFFLKKCFVGQETSIEKPQFLDNTILEVPGLAIEGLAKEFDRYRDILVASTRGFLSLLRGESTVLPRIEKLNNISDAIMKFIVKMTQSSIGENLSERLIVFMKIHDQYKKSTNSLQGIIRESKNYQKIKTPLKIKLYAFVDICDELLEYIDRPFDSKPKGISQKKLRNFDSIYEQLQKFLLRNFSQGNLSIQDYENIHRLITTLYTILYSLAKAQKITISHDITKKVK